MKATDTVYVDRAGELLIRFFDVTAGLLALAVMSPFFALIMLAIRLSDGGPVSFRQTRPGSMGRSFTMYKFRSMVVGASRIGQGLYIDGEHDDRITTVGRVIRKWSLDELPQLLNIIKGDMSIVGPRPAMPFQVKQYTARQKRRLTVKPGLTGWAQVNGRNSLSWPERIEYDLWYIEHRSLLLNLRIILKTIPAVLKPSGLYAARENYLLATGHPAGASAHAAPTAENREPVREAKTLIVRSS